ncbi:MAG: peptidyl-prolyl cis-trans isomerase, partial [Acidobacteria bacterium]|nr:peptidyl-prolyl cis-trans isomerase [Acidobacteriota bacterium]
VTDGVTVTPEEVRDAFYRDNEKVVLSYVFLDPATFQKDVTPTDEALQNYYQQNKDRYLIPEKRQVQLLLLEQQQVRKATTISEEEIRRYYEDRKDNYRSEERVQVSHILLMAPETDAVKVEEAKKKAEGLLQKLRQGAEFAVLAKENSQDEGTAANGGEVGWILRGQTVPEFENLAFSLAPGTISDPIQTVYGIHILKVVAHESARLRPLDEVRQEIEDLLLEDKVQVSLTELAEEAAAALRRPGADMTALAQKYHGVVWTPPPFSQEDSVERIGTVPAFQQEVFVLRKGDVGQPISVPEGQTIPVLLDVFPAHPGELSEVQEKVREDYLKEQGREKAQAKAQELADILAKQATKDLQQAVRSLGLSVRTTGLISRQDIIPGLGRVQDFGTKVFTLQAGEVEGPVNVASGQVVYQVDSRQLPKEEDLESQRESIRQKLLGEKQNRVFGIFQDDLKHHWTASGDLRIHSAALQQLISGGASTP